MRFRFTVLLCLIALSAYSQSDCSIQVANENSDDVIRRQGFDLTQDDSGQQWSIGSDQLTLELAPGDQSSELIVNGFNPNIPQGSQILGVSILISGSAIGGQISDRTIQYSTPSSISNNVANSVSIGNSWTPEQSNWLYGNTFNTLGGDVIIDDLNNNEIDFAIQIANEGIDTSTVVINEVSLMVRFRKPAQVCPDHLCIIFYLPNASQSSSYTWSTPDGFELLDDNNSVSIVGINVDPSTPDGLYEICVTETVPGGGQQECCRTVRLSDCGPSSLGDAVFNDLNQNGMLDADEDGISGVTVNLFDDESNLISSTVTGDNGSYQFGGLSSGFYQIGIVTDGTLSPTFASSFSENEEFLSEVIFLQDSENIVSLDFGLIALQSINGNVYIDNNCNGSQDIDEAGFAGLGVILFDGSGNLITTTTVNIDGSYEFAGLEMGDYAIVLGGFDSGVYTPTVLGSSPNGNQLTEIEGIPTTGVFSIEEDTQVDLGLKFIAGSVSGFVFEDANGNNELNVNEGSIDDVNVTLFTCEGDVVQTFLTNADGAYAFNEVPIGDYYVEFSVSNLESNNAITSTEAGGNDLTGENGLNTTSCFTVAALEMASISAGFFEFSVIGDFVWNDLNENGFQNPEEEGVNDVTVSLFSADSTLVAQTITAFSSESDLNGQYLFNSVAPGEYYVQFDISEEFSFSPPLTMLTQLNSDVTGANGAGTTDTFVVTSGSTNSTIDAGIFVPTTTNAISGLVFDDISGNGFFEDEDFGISGVFVVATAEDGDIFTTVTDTTGMYTLDNLPNGIYQVTIAIDSIYNLTFQDIGSDDTIDSDFGEAPDGTIILEEIQLDGDLTVSNIDAGFFRYGTITGVVWIDDNRDGIRDADELTIDGLSVVLDGDLTGTDITENDGSYAFDFLIPGTYTIRFDLDSIYIFSPTNQGDDDTIDSDIVNTVGVLGNTTNIFIESGLVVSNVDIGLIEVASNLGSISGVVWIDDNGDGIRDSSDEFLADYPVVLNTPNGSITTTTDQTGAYLFDQLFPGVYNIEAPLMESVFFSPGNQGDDDTVDSDITVVASDNGTTTNLFLSIGEEISNIDIGLTVTPEPGFNVITGYIFEDISGNGFSEDEDTGIEDVLIVATGTNGSTFSGSTNSEGIYTISNLPDDTYQLTVGIDSIYNLTFSNVGTDDTIDSDFVQEGGSISLPDGLVVADDITVDNIDAGFFRYGIVSGVVWFDLNGNGIREDEDTLVSGATVNLSGEQSAIEITDADGSYSFNTLQPGTFSISFDLDSTVVFTVPDQGDDAVDSDIIITSTTEGSTTNIFIESGLVRENVDIGLKDAASNLGSISGVAWLDVDNDGVRTDVDQLIPNFTVTLNGLSTGPITITTDENGAYRFTDLVNGVYNIAGTTGTDQGFTLADIGDDTVDNDIANVNGNIGNTRNIFVDPGENVMNIDLGIRERSGRNSITGFVFEDVSGNGFFEDEDFSIEGVTIIATGSNGVTFTAVTDDNGVYIITDLLDDTYEVSIMIDSVYNLTLPNIGTDDTIDSDFIFSGTSLVLADDIELEEDITVENIDAGFFRYGVINGIVWLDLNGNGIRDVDDPSLEGQTVMLSGSQEGTMVTGPDGSYSFDNLVPGTFVVTYDLDGTFGFTSADQGGDDTLDSDILILNAMGGSTTNIFIESGLVRNNVDVGLIDEVSLLGSISGLAWFDIDNDGVREIDDPTIEGYTVTLNTSAGPVNTVTNADGTYIFTDLDPGVYSIAGVVDDNATFTIPNVGDDTLDSDITNINGNSGSTMNIFINFANLNRTNVDIGLAPLNVLDFPGVITGTIFEDLFADGLLDPIDAGMAGIDVILFDTQETVVATTQTDVNGDYVFDNLPNGDYIVRIVATEMLTTMNVGSDDTIDSDFSLINGVYEASTTISDMMDISDLDAGFFILTELSGLVWEDLNGDGIRTNNEPLISGAQVFLRDSDQFIVGVGITDENGYVIPNLRPGIYSIQHTKSSDQEFSPGGQGTDATVNSDLFVFDGNLGSSTNIFQTSGITSTNIDIGLVPETAELNQGTISGLIFHDNFDGLSIDDDPIEGFQLHLINAMTEDTIGITSSDVFGNYRFNNIPNGTYQVAVDLTEGFVLTTPNIGTNDLVDSDFIDFGVDGILSEIVTIDDTNTEFVFDAGFFRTGTISGIVWFDENGDGIRNLDDAIIQPYEVILLKGGLVYQTTTATEDGYSFSGLLPDTYRVAVMIDGELFVMTLALQGNDDTLDSDIVNLDGDLSMTNDIVINSGDIITSIDAGLFPVNTGVENIDSTLTVNIFEDLNLNGLSNPGSSFEATFGATIIDQESGIVVLEEEYEDVSTFTLDNFGLADGDYTLTITSFENLTFANVGNNDAIDSDFELDSDGNYTVDFEVVQSLFSPAILDLGVFGVGMISGRVWRDIDENGIQELEDELFPNGGVANAVLTLIDVNNIAVQSLTTESDGLYEFSGLLPGTYRVTADLPQNGTFTEADIYDDTADSDITIFFGSNGTTEEIQLLSGQAIDRIDVGVILDVEGSLDANISGIAWEDLNANGVFDQDEPLQDGLFVTLFREDGSILDQTMTGTSPITGFGGFYQFNVSEFGNAYLQFSSPGNTAITSTAFQGLSTFIDSDITNANGEITTDIFNVMSGTVLEGTNYGFFFEGSVGDLVWLDENNNGLQDLEEQGLNDVTVQLFDQTGTLIQTVQSQSVIGVAGIYSFSGLTPGEYSIGIEQPESLMVTTQDSGDDDNIDSDINAASFQTAPFTIVSNQQIFNVDIGLSELPPNVGNRVFVDIDGNSVQSEGDLGLDGVQVDLFSEDGSLVETTFTETVGGESGIYGFGQVPTGNYFIVFTPSDEDYLFVPANEGNSDIVDSDVTSIAIPGSTNIFSVTEGIPDLDIDAGVYLPSTVGDYVWMDANEDGIQDPTEVGVDALQVEIYFSTGEFVDATNTNINGFYEFDDLQAGEYYVQFRLEGEFEFTVLDSGNNDTLDSDAGDAGLTDVFTLGYNEVQSTKDAGVIPSEGRISGSVWIDADESGSNDFDESGMGGVRVELLDENQEVLEISFTNGLGNYTFASLDADSYFVRVVRPIGYKFASSPFFIDDNENSDVDEDTGITELLNLNANSIKENVDAGLIDLNGVAQDDTQNLTVFPNPTVGNIQLGIELPVKENENVLVRIFDQSGHNVMNIDVPVSNRRTNRIDVSQLRSGSYQVYLEMQGQVWRQQLLVIE